MDFSIDNFTIPYIPSDGKGRSYAMNKTLKLVPPLYRNKIHNLMVKKYPRTFKTKSPRRFIKRYKEILNTLPSELLCVDFEMYERANEKITEFGYSIINIQDNKITTKHFIIKEHYKHRNKKFVIDNKDNFNYGESEFINLSELKSIIFNLLNNNALLVGHGIHNDTKIINQILDDESRVHIGIIDTNLIHNLLKSENKQSSLANLCKEYNVKIENPHNAGNDSQYTSELFLKMYARWIENNDQN